MAGYVLNTKPLRDVNVCSHLTELEDRRLKMKSYL